LPPSIEEMKRRILGRWTETEETFQIRLNTAIREYWEQDKYDIKIINDDIEKAKEELIEILTHD
jgi:guanylate kinase